jgi:hypothetical protein
MKKDLVIAAIAGYRWEQIRAFVISLDKSGFRGDRVLLTAHMDLFTLECAANRGFKIVPFDIPDNPSAWTFVCRQRFGPLIQFLAQHRHKYQNVIWTDVADLIFQSNPSSWLASNVIVGSRTLVLARECWRIKDELKFNDPWIKTAFPNDYEWLREQEVLCGGTLAGDAETVFEALVKIFKITSEQLDTTDQAALNYVVHKPFGFPSPTHLYVPAMRHGWTATCSAFLTENFHSIIGQSPEALTDSVPVFDYAKGLVLIPDGKTPFVIVHQYNRDRVWARIIPAKYAWD